MKMLLIQTSSFPSAKAVPSNKGYLAGYVAFVTSPTDFLRTFRCRVTQQSKIPCIEEEGKMKYNQRILKTFLSSIARMPQLSPQ